jgi:hypothetical protein
LTESLSGRYCSGTLINGVPPGIRQFRVSALLSARCTD